MSKILNRKLNELKIIQKYECWYVVKQKTDFYQICYLVKFLEEFMNSSELKEKYSLKDFIEYRVNLEDVKNKNITPIHRALKYAEVFGLINKKKGKYDESVISEVFRTIVERTECKFEEIEKYSDIIKRQIEKIFMSSKIDEEREDVRKKFKLYPVMLLYKVLLEIGHLDKEKYFISNEEYMYLVTTTTKYENYLQTLLEIIELRNNSEYISEFKKYENKLDNRMNKVLEQLDTLEFKENNIYLKKDKIDEVKEKIFKFEKNFYQYQNLDYIDFLCSNKSLFDIFEENLKIKINKNLGDIPLQKIYFGAPGTGKSYKLNKESKESFYEKNIERVTFHPNYSYGNFVGTYKPVEENKNITYKFVPGILVSQLKKAYENPNNNYLVIIEEINRANVSAVFGDTFQLLDRDSSGESEYPINLSEDLLKYFDENLEEKKYLNKEYVEKDKLIKLYFPSNLYIWATMNSADQGVQPLDTAFKRRWDFEYIGIDDGVTDDFKNYIFKIKNNEEKYIRWNDFREKINMALSEAKIPEDKLMGPYFISKNVLDTSGPDRLKEVIKNKVLMYLYEDVLKISRNKLFNQDYSKKYSDLCTQFDIDVSSIFIDEVKKIILDNDVIDDPNTVLQNSQQEETE